MSPSTVQEGDRVRIHSAGKWVSAVVENVNRGAEEVEVRFEVQSPPNDAIDALVAQLAAAKRELEEYRIAAAKLPNVAPRPTVEAPIPAPTEVAPLVPRLENLPSPAAATQAATAESIPPDNPSADRRSSQYGSDQDCIWYASDADTPQHG